MQRGLVAKQVALMRAQRLLLCGVEIELDAGECLHICGPNGCGKSSLLAALAGLILPVHGEIRWNGVKVSASNHGIAYLGHHLGLKASLTVREHMLMWRTVADLDGQQQALCLFRLEDLQDRPVRQLSAGQQQRLALLRVYSEPRASLWLLDEPLAALDDASQAILMDVIQAHLRAGGTLVLSSHQALHWPSDLVLRQMSLQAPLLRTQEASACMI